MAVMDLISTGQAAKIIGCTEGRVRQMLRSGEMIGQKVGERAWVVTTGEAERVRDTERKIGRPPKSS